MSSGLSASALARGQELWEQARWEQLGVPPACACCCRLLLLPLFVQTKEQQLKRSCLRKPKNAIANAHCRRAREVSALDELKRWAATANCAEAERLLAKAQLQCAYNALLG